MLRSVMKRCYLHILYNLQYLQPMTCYGPGVDSASNRSEYQEYFLGVKTAGV